MSRASDRREGRGWPGFLFGGRVRTSTVALLIAFFATWWIFETYQPAPAPPEQVPANEIVPPGFIPDPAYTWAPRTDVQQRPPTPTTPTTPTSAGEEPAAPTPGTGTEPTATSEGPLPGGGVVPPPSPSEAPVPAVPPTPPLPTPGLPTTVPPIPATPAPPATP